MGWLFKAGVVAFGVVVLIAESFIRHNDRRRLFKVGSTFVLAGMATIASSAAIQEKWRLRHEWVQSHFEEVNAMQQEISITDGANIVFGPVLFG